MTTVGKQFIRAIAGVILLANFVGAEAQEFQPPSGDEPFLLSADRPYDLTHEVFALTRDGRAPFPGAGDPAAALAGSGRTLKT